MKSSLVSVTTVRQGDPNNLIERIRANIFLDTALEHAQLGVSICALYSSCTEEYLRKMENLGVILFEEKSKVMGHVRREIMRIAKEKYQNNTWFLWLEPEKPDILRCALEVLSETQNVGCNECFFNRLSMSSYPEEQSHYYLFIRSIATQLFGFDFDYGFGPMLISKSGIHHFLNYDGEHGDLWDSTLVPRIRLIKSGEKFCVSGIDFRNDSRMTAVERGNPNIIIKRLAQLDNVTKSLLKEFNK